MKTLEKVEEEIAKVKTQWSQAKDMGDSIGSKLHKKLSKEILFLQFVKNYLEGNPTKQSIERQLTEAESHIEGISNGYTTWQKTCYVGVKSQYPTSINGDPLKLYHQIMERNKFEKQVKTLKFILK